MRFIVLRRSDGSGNFQEADPLHQAYLTGLEAVGIYMLCLKTAAGAVYAQKLAVIH